MPDPKYGIGFRKASNPTKVISMFIPHYQSVMKNAGQLQGADALILSAMLLSAVG